MTTLYIYRLFVLVYPTFSAVPRFGRETLPPHHAQTKNRRVLGTQQYRSLNDFLNQVINKRL